MTQDPIKRNFLTVPEIAKRLHVAERTVQNWCQTNELKAEPLDPDRERTSWIVSIAEVERFEKERKRDDT